MAVYTVHEPPLKRYETASEPDRCVLVRDGFSFWAFLLGPLWMLRHRMWLVLLGYVLAAAAIGAALHFAHVSAGTTLFAGAAIAFLIGMEAGTLRRFTLGRRRFSHVGVVVADDRDLAERRFFDSWSGNDRLLSPSSAPQPVLRRVPTTSDVLGLFPEPGASR